MAQVNQSPVALWPLAKGVFFAHSQAGHSSGKEQINQESRTYETKRQTLVRSPATSATHEPHEIHHTRI